MKHTKNTALLAALALTACMSTACTADRSSDTTKPSAGASKVADTASASAAPAKDGKKSITISETNAFTSMNSDSKTGNKDINSKVGAAMFASLFTVTPELKVKINTEIGNIEKISDSPLKVKYSVKETTKWSDGNAVDAGDLMLAWAFNSGYYDSYKKVKDKETGTQYFKYAGSKDGLKDSLLPVIGEDGRSITVEYTKPFADWQITMNLPSTPAHVVAKRAKLADENALIELFKKPPRATLKHLLKSRSWPQLQRSGTKTSTSSPFQTTKNSTSHPGHSSPKTSSKTSP